MNRNIVAGNWKMNLSMDEALALHEEVEKSIKNNSKNCSVYQFAPSIYLPSLTEKNKEVMIGAQNGHPNDSGAFTGEVSMKQLQEINTNAILVGHSERRTIFQESDAFLKEKVTTAIEKEMTVFFCCGESLEEREKETHEEKILSQLENSLFHLSAADFKQVVIAYEPIWAIGTGKTASPEQANDMHKFIRQKVAEKYSEEIANQVSILYGGSCKPDNAKELFSQPDIDGGLIGGASLKAEDFLAIIDAFGGIK